MLKVFSVPILKDNYVHLIVETSTSECIIVDPGEAEPVINYIEKSKLKPRALYLTHHHGDHIGGALELKQRYRLIAYAPEFEKDEMNFADVFVREGDSVQCLGTQFEVMQLCGHTRGHIGFYAPSPSWLFSGDVVFSLGCGRIFDGTIEDHFESLQKIKKLPPQTKIYCTHEYTETNLRFVQKNFPANPEINRYATRVQDLRAENLPTVPLLLRDELAMNPFLRAKNFQEFKELRELRNEFR